MSKVRTAEYGIRLNNILRHFPPTISVYNGDNVTKRDRSWNIILGGWHKRKRIGELWLYMVIFNVIIAFRLLLFVNNRLTLTLKSLVKDDIPWRLSISINRDKT